MRDAVAEVGAAVRRWIGSRRRQLTAGVLCALAFSFWGAWRALLPDPHLGGFENHDTRVIVGRIAADPDPVAWFTGDWPLGNGFYRPLPTLLYWLDLTLWGQDFSLYRITNVVLAVGVVVGLLWALASWGVAWWVAVACAALMGIWQSDLVRALPVEALTQWVALGVVLFGLLQRGRARWALIGAGALLCVVGRELSFEFFPADLHGKSFGYRAMGWIPGRTALLAALFVWLSVGSFARYAATRRPAWGVACALAYACALGSYEAAVVLAPALTLAARWWLPTRSKSIAILLAILWAIALGFTLWHFLALDKSTSYLQARDRSYLGTALGLGTWLFPALPELNALRAVASEEDVWPALLLLEMFWAQLGLVLASGIAWWMVLRRAPNLMGVLVLSTLCYLPMAMQQPLTHYAYLGAGVRTVFVMGLIGLLIEQFHRLRRPQYQVAKREPTPAAAGTVPT